MTAETGMARRGRATKAERLGRGREARLRRLRATLREQMLSAPALRATPGAAGAGDAIEGTAGTEEDAMLADAVLLEDPLPEDAVYRDEGCEVARSCLACPLALCVLERPGSPSERRREGRDRLIRLLLGRGWSAARVAKQFDLSAAQVRRIRASGPLG